MARLLVVHPDLGLQAALTVLFAHRVAIDSAATLGELPPDLPMPDAIVLDGTASGRADPPDLDRIRRRGSACTVISVVGPQDTRAGRLARSGRLAASGSRPLRFGELFGRLAQMPAPFVPLPGLAVSRAIEHLSGHYAERLDVAAVAAVAELSSSRLAHRFPPETGLSVKEFLGRLRVEVAKQILATRPLPLERVAELTGFADASHLSRVFRRYTWRRPGVYRRALTPNGARPVRHVFFLPAHGVAAVLSTAAADLSIVRRGSLG